MMTADYLTRIAAWSRAELKIRYCVIATRISSIG
jgi:hypothetical protein